MDTTYLQSLLDEKVDQYERPDFIVPDPISIPHRYSHRQDIEITGLLASTIAWGNRKAIVKSAAAMADMLGADPFDFVMSANEEQIGRLSSFVYRTFQKDDLLPWCAAALHLLTRPRAWVGAALCATGGETLREGLIRFREAMLPNIADRTRKHIADAGKGAAAKRLCMFLRWMVRPSKRGVDFGLWDSMSPADLVIPLDVHTGRTARDLGLLLRTQSDWKAAMELTNSLARFCPADPVRYDFALFSIGIVEGGI